MVIIGASQALDPGSIPGERSTRTFGGISSIGRVRALQARGTGIETPMLQVVVFNFTFDTIFSSIGFPIRPVLAKAPGLDGRAVQGARLKFESLRRRGFEPHLNHFLFVSAKSFF